MRNSTLHALARGAAAGAAGVTALNAVTYADMAVRGRPGSSTPEHTVEAIARMLRTRVPGDEKTRPARLTGLGALFGTATGIETGATYGLLRSCGWRPSVVVGGLAAGGTVLVGTAASMTVLGVTDPRSWSVSDWISDLVPHLAYGMVTSAVFAATEHSSRRVGLRALRR